MKMPNLRTDVVVIGAGPAGSTTARVIAEHGFDVVLVEKDRYPGETNVCAGAMPRAIFKDMRLPSDIIEKEILIEKHYFPWGIKVFKPDHVSVYRNVFDRNMANKAVESGAKLLTDTLIEDVHVKRERIDVISKGKKVIESQIVVFADGPNTLAYRKFGIGFAPKATDVFLSVTVEVKWENNPIDFFGVYYNYDISPWGYGWICPRRDTINAGVLCLYDKLRSNPINSLNYFISKHPLKDLRAREIVWLRSALIPVAPARKIYGKRMLVVGDAAGMVDPVSGEGIIHAITGGKLAGEVCVKALEEENFSSSFLSKYQTLWHKATFTYLYSKYPYLYSKYLLSNIFLYLYKLDRNAYPMLAALTRAGTREIFNTLKFIIIDRLK